MASVLALVYNLHSVAHNTISVVLDRKPDSYTDLCVPQPGFYSVSFMLMVHITSLVGSLTFLSVLL